MAKKDATKALNWVDLAAQLEAAAPQGSERGVPEGAQGMSLGKLIASVNSFRAAVSAKDWFAAMKAARDFLDALVDDAGSSTDGGTIQLAPLPAQAGFNWGRIGELFKKILPILIDLALTERQAISA